MEREQFLPPAGLSPAPQLFAARWLQQFVALLRKNGATLTFRWRSSLLFVVLPSAFIVGLYYLVTSLSGLDTSPQALRLSRCTAFDVESLPTSSGSCITLAYAPAATADRAVVDSVAASIAASSGLQLGVDIVAFASSDEMAGWMYDHASTQVDAAVVIDATAAGQATYEIWSNATLPALYQSSGMDTVWQYSGYSGRLLAVQVALERGILASTLSSATGKPVYVSLDASLAPFDEVSPLSGGVSDPTSVAQYLYGPAFLSIGVVGASLLVLVQVSGEKHRKLLGMLKTVGLLDSAYWVSWFVSYLPLILATALLTPASGAISKLILFTRVDYSVHFLAIFLLGTATVAMALTLSACVSRPAWVAGVAFIQFALAVSLTIVFSAIGLYRLAYLPTVPTGLTFLFVMWPFFSFGRLMSTAMQFVLTGGSSLDTNSASSSPFSGGDDVPSFGWKQLQQTPPAQTIYVNGLPQQWTDRPASYDLGMLCVLTLVYMVLAWYCSTISTGAPVYFFLLPSYWGFAGKKKSKDSVLEGDTLAHIQQASAAEGSIRVHKLSKSYKQVQALKEVSLTLRPDAVTALLGQNGAGKSTLIALLTGLTEPTHGVAYALGQNIAQDIGALRSVMGSCPQDDLLWEELTPAAHLSLFASLKGLNGAALEEQVQAQLELVCLQKEAHNPVVTFSGGMKRRLSVAIASIGAPKILTLDEPTTGLDPLSRRQVWDIIQALKPGRILLLTTHSMEEADALADEVALLAGGRLRAVGTPLFLKASYGSGYSINIMAHPARVDAVRALIQAHLQGAEVVGDAVAAAAAAAAAAQATQQPGVPGAPTQAFTGSGNGSLTVSIPFTSLHLIPPFLRLLDSMSEGNSAEDSAAEDDVRVVREWGLSLSSLEEVFLRLASREHEVNAGAASAAPAGPAVAGAGGQSAMTVTGHSRRLCALCEAAPTARVSVYNSKGMQITSSDLLCAECADRDSDAVAQVKQTLAAQRAALVASLKAGGGAVPTPVPAALEDVGSSTAPPSSSKVSFPPAGVNAVETSAGAERAPEVIHAETVAVPALPVPLWDAGRAGAGRTAAQPAKAAGLMDSNGPPPPPAPVPFYVQFAAVLRLQLNLSAPSKYNCRGILCSSFCANIVLVLIAIIVTVATAGGQRQINLTQCAPGSYWMDNTTGLCNRDVYAAYMTGAVARTATGSQWSSEAPEGRVAGMPARAARAAGARSAPPAAAPVQVYVNPQPTAVLLYKSFCPDPSDETAPACIISGGVSYTAPDFTSLTDLFQAGVSGVGMNPLPVVGYADTQARAAGDASYTPFTALNLLEGLDGASVLPTPIIHRLDVTTAPLYEAGAGSPNGYADPNKYLVAVQEQVRAGERPLNSTCYGANVQQTQTQYAYPVDDVLAFQNASLLAAGVTFRRLATGSSGASAGQGIALAYDLRVPALLAYTGGSSGSNVYRGNEYYFLTAVRTLASSCDFVTPVQAYDNLLDGAQRGTSDGAYTNTGRTAYVLANMVHGAFLRAALAAVGAPGAAAAYIHGAFVPMPPIQWVPGQGYAPLSPYQTLVWPLFTMTILPGIVSAVSTERTEKLWAMMAMSGVRRGPYLAAHLATGMLAFLPVGGMYVLVGALAGAASFIFPAPGLLALLLLLWAFCQASWGILLGTLIPSPRLGAILCYLLAVGISLTNLLVTANYTPWPQHLTWIPFLSYARASSLVLSATGVPGGSKGTEMWTALGITFLEGALALCLGVYLHAVLPMPEQTGVPQHPLFPLYALLHWWERISGGSKKGKVMRSRVGRDIELSGPDASPLIGTGTGGDDRTAVRVKDADRRYEEAQAASEAPNTQLDVDVAAEAAWAEEAAASMGGSSMADGQRGSGDSRYGTGAAILLYHLRKLYWPEMSKQVQAALTRTPAPAPKAAVRGVSLAVRYGQTLGLLGPNGAGKTTIISMLTGSSNPTSGMAWIAGCDVSTELTSAWRRLGVCPQFDCVWPGLTVRGHLDFYAWAKGVPFSALRAAVQSAAEKVGLDGDCFSMPAGKLSGGQRRRLSIAIALLGDPDVVILDEPTTGLDPENRNGVHRILAKEKRAGRAVLLTTHSMEEADVLCDRIAILAQGQLRAVGSQQRLKSRFGSGYRLTVHLDALPATLEATAARAHAFVVGSVCAQAVLLSRVGTTLSYILPRQVDVAAAFAVLDGARGKGSGIAEFGVQQSSLEEVFIKIVRSAE